MLCLQTTIINVSKKEKNLTENNTISIVSEIHTKQSTNDKNLSLSITAFCRKAKAKVDTYSLRNLRLLPRNLNEILLS